MMLKAPPCIHNFQIYKIIRSLASDIYEGIFTLREACGNQSN